MILGQQCKLNQHSQCHGTFTVGEFPSGTDFIVTCDCPCHRQDTAHLRPEVGAKHDTSEVVPEVIRAALDQWRDQRPNIPADPWEPFYANVGRSELVALLHAIVTPMLYLIEQAHPLVSPEYDWRGNYIGPGWHTCDTCDPNGTSLVQDPGQRCATVAMTAMYRPEGSHATTEQPA